MQLDHPREERIRCARAYTRHTFLCVNSPGVYAFARLGDRKKKKEYFPIIWIQLRPFNIRRDASAKEVGKKLEERVIEAWDNMYRTSVADDYWCRMLIPSGRTAGMELVLWPNFMLSQVISSHAYLGKIGKRNSPSCRCSCAEQTPVHLSLIHI